MAKISETELQRRLKSLEKKTAFSLKIVISDIDPVGTDHAEGSEHYNSTTGNLYIFSNGAWELTATKLHIMYATVVTNLSEEGIAPSQGDVTGFSELPYTAGGLQKDYRGLWFGGRTASTDSTDYIWTLTAGESGAVPTYERYYSNTAGLASEMGDPTTPGAGITWISISTSATTPSTAYWVAERYTLSGVVTSWQIYPVQAKDSGIPFVTYTKAGFNMPVLGDSTWITDAVAAVTAFTGRPYTNQKEFGYGTVVVITYDNGKLYGTYKRSGSVDTWTTPASFIDGDLIVDGTIAADHMQANSIDATKLVVTGLNPIIASTIGADTAGSAATAESNAIAASDPVGSASTAQSNAIAASDPVGSASTAQSNAISTSGTNADAKVAVVTDNIYTTSTTTIDGGKITTGSVTATQITATSLSAITADLGTITTGKLENTDSSFVIDLTNKTMYIR